jgi:hypothetical protein
MYQAFSYTGIWWLPDSPDLPVAGTLTYDPGNGVILNLFGVLSEGHRNQNDLEFIPIINGVISKGAKHVTLWSCDRSNLSTSWGQAESTMFSSNYTAARAIIGKHFIIENEIQFTGLSASYSSLEQWVNRQPFHLLDEQNPFCFSHTPVDLSVELDDLRLTIRDWIGGSFDVEKRVAEHKAALSVHFNSPVDFQTAYSKLEHLRNFVSLGVGEAVKIRTLNGKIPDDIVPVEIYERNRNVDILEYGKTVNVHRMIFTLGDLGNQFDTVLKKWYSSWENLEHVYGLFFAVLDTPSMYLDIQFELLVRTLEVYHRRTSNGRYMSKEDFKAAVLKPVRNYIEKELNEISPNYKQRLSDNVAFWNEYALKERLHEIINGLRQQYASQIDQLIQDQEAFVKFVVNTRNLLTHYSLDDKNKNLPDGNTYLWYIHRMKALIVMCFLKELGLSTSLGAKIIEKYKYFKFSVGDLWL